ncbi:MAG: response regulator [Defluviitaleaceae bacterium]|nr:response regulator [Defluviitaleaceae bacterium]
MDKKKAVSGKEEMLVRISDKKKLLDISDLNVEKISEMTEDQLYNYTESLSTFLEIFPAQKERLKVAMQAKEYASVLQWLTSIGNALSRIHADGLAKNCQKQVGLNQNIEGIRHEKLVTFVNFFMASLSILYDDIQNVLERQEPEIEGGEAALLEPEELRKKILSVTELSAEKIKQIDDENLPDFIGLLNVFTSDIPKQERRLKNVLKSKDYASVLHKLESIGNSLAQIHADDLLEEYQDQIKTSCNIDNVRHEKLEAFVDYFFASLTMLVSEIQQNVPINIMGISEFLPFKTDPSKKNILVIDDTVIFLQNLKRILENNENKVTCIASKESALIYLKIARPNLFILNDDMPGMDGCEFAKKIREMKHTVPIIYLTSNATKEYMVKSMAAGVTDFIIKPISATDAQEKVDRHLLNQGDC